MQPVDLGALVSHPGTESSLGGAVLPGLPNAMTNAVSLPCRVSLPESHHFWGYWCNICNQLTIVLPKLALLVDKTK